MTKVMAIHHEDAARKYAAKIGAKHYHNCSSDPELWQIGQQVYRLVREAPPEVAKSPGMPTIVLPGRFTVTPNGGGAERRPEGGE